MAVVRHNEYNGSIYRQQRKRHSDYPILKMSVNDFWLCILGYLRGDWLQTSINKVLAAFGGKNDSGTLPTPFWTWASMEPQQFLVFHLWLSKCHFVAIIHLQCSGSHFSQNSAWYLCYNIFKMSVNRASTIFGLVYWVINASHGYLSS